MCHIENGFSPYFFKNAVWALTSGGFRIVSDTLVLHCVVKVWFIWLTGASGVVLF